MNAKQLSNTLNLIAAFKSGDYAQIQGHLVYGRKDDLCFCAEGLACYVAGLEIKYGKIGRAQGFECDGEFRSVTAHAKWFTDFYGFNPNTPLLNGRSLIQVNDTLNLTFPEIGDLLQENLDEGKLTQ